MSILDSRKVDFIGIEVGSNDVILTISDHLDWKNSEFHLEKLKSVKYLFLFLPLMFQ